MSEDLQLAAAVLAVFFVYLGAKVWSYMRASKAQWKQVDKSKLKQWKEDD
jgi:hypothetical protein